MDDVRQIADDTAETLRLLGVATLTMLLFMVVLLLSKCIATVRQLIQEIAWLSDDELFPAEQPIDPSLAETRLYQGE